MKGQSEIVVFILLFMVGVSLFLSSVMWSQGIFTTNSDMAKVNFAENFMVNLDDKIQNIIKFGGEDSINYGINAPISLIGFDTIEISTPLTVRVSEDWVNTTVGNSIIRQRSEDNLFRIQLNYPYQDYGIFLYTDGPKTATPQKITIRKGDSFVENGKQYIRIEITFK